MADASGGGVIAARRNATALALLGGLIGVMGLGHLYEKRPRRGVLLLAIGLSLDYVIIAFYYLLAPQFSGWNMPGFIAPGTGEVRGISFTLAVTVFLLALISQVVIYFWQAYDVRRVSSASAS